MNILAIHHIQLAIPRNSEDEARGFYGTLLGLQEVPKPEELASRGGVWFESNKLRLHLGVEEDFQAARKAHPAFLVSDILQLKSKLLEYGVNIIQDKPLEGYERFYAQDPFGNRLEFLAPVSGADSR
jgi:catechol 2,3-dioxygenase-like lactoylglutathione lyase family enzyme